MGCVRFNNFEMNDEECITDKQKLFFCRMTKSSLISLKHID